MTTPKRIVRSTWVCAAALTTLASLATIGCTYSTDTTEPVAGVTQALWSTTELGAPDYWPDGRVQTCFWPGAGYTASHPDYVARTTAARTVIQRELNSIEDSSLMFVGWQNCPSSNPRPGWFRITLINSSAAQAGTSPAGYNASGETVSTFYAGSYPLGAAWDTVVLHEIVHALGFDHELRRTDGNTIFTSAGCVPGTNGVDGDPNNPWDGIRFTQYDPMSIENGTYCHWNGKLSALDRLGIAIVYPRSNSPSAMEQKVQVVDGYPIVTGTGFILRGDDPGHYAPDWIARGGHADAFGGIAPDKDIRWRFAPWGRSVPGDTIYGALEVPTDFVWSSYLISGQFSDFLNREYLLSATTVTVDDSRHTAVLASAFM